MGGSPLFRKTGWLQKGLPLLIPLIFAISTVLQDLFCYGSLSGCKSMPLFGGVNVTYNNKTMYGWFGLLVAASALHANVLAFARSGKLTSLFSRVPYSIKSDSKVRQTIRAWVAGWVFLVTVILIITLSFIVVEIDKGCSYMQLLCLIPQSIQIVSGLSMVCTGVGLSYLVSLLVILDVEHTQERSKSFINEAELQSQLKEFVELKARIKQLGKDTQVGNAVAVCAACVCILGSLWAFAVVDYQKKNDPDGKSNSIIWSISLWMCLISLLLTFLAIFSFSNVTQACDNLMESTRDEISNYVIKKETSTVTLSECFLMIASHQQRFGFEIMGILVEPEIVRAGAYAGVTAAAAVLKLAI